MRAIMTLWIVWHLAPVSPVTFGGRFFFISSGDTDAEGAGRGFLPCTRGTFDRRDRSGYVFAGTAWGRRKPAAQGRRPGTAKAISYNLPRAATGSTAYKNAYPMYSVAEARGTEPRLSGGRRCMAIATATART